MLDFQTEKGAPTLFPEKGKKKAFRAARKTRRKLMFYECELSCINFNINFSPRRDPWDLPSSTKYMGPIETDKLNCVCRTGRARRLLRVFVWRAKVHENSLVLIPPFPDHRSGLVVIVDTDKDRTRHLSAHTRILSDFAKLLVLPVWF